MASSDDKFATSGVNIGLFCSTPMVALSRNVSRKLAMEMLLLGDFLPATRTAELVLVSAHPGTVSVAMPDDKWGEVRCAFVELLVVATITEDDLLAHAHSGLVGFQRPKKIVFGELPNITTGKVWKIDPRELAKSL